MSLLKKIIGGGIVYFIRQILITIIGIVVTLTLTRLLQPADFGYISFVTIVLGAITLLSDGGLGLPLVQKKGDVTAEELSKIAYIQLGFWLVFEFICLIIYFFYNNFSNIDVKGLLYLTVATTSIPFAILKSGSIIMLERKLAFNKIAIIEVCEQLIYTLFAIILTLLNFGVWGIVIATILKVFLTYLLARYFYRWNFRIPNKNSSKIELLNILKTGISYQFPSILETARNAINPLFIGTIYGMKYAGFTDRAILVASLPVSLLGSVWQKILFPLVARIQTDKKTLENLFSKSVYIHSIFDKALYLPLFLFGSSYITFFIGEKWLPILPVVLIFSFGNILFSAYSSTSIAFFRGLGKPKILAYWSMIQLPLAIISIFCFSQFYGFIGYALGSQMLWAGVFYNYSKLKKHLDLLFLKSIIIPLVAFLATYIAIKFIFNYDYTQKHFIFFSILSEIIYFFILTIIDYKRVSGLFFIIKNNRR
jgi:O-antigen/teichoic acid export membrane protein